MKFALPPVIGELIVARNKVRDHYASSALTFTLDGNLIGDLGEALAADIFGIKLIARNGTGIDGHALDGRSVQVKASATKRGPAFRMVDTRAQHLLFFHLDMDACEGELLYNGPEEIALGTLKAPWTGQRMISVPQIRAANARVSEDLRLQPVSHLINALGS
jgi:hypothetical protein